MSQAQELTQLGLDDDESSNLYCPSPFAPIDPLTIPWGKLIAPNNSEAVEMTPRPPEHPPESSRSARSSTGRSPSPPNFMGLRHLRPGDRFNEYTMGRSAKADVTVSKTVDASHQRMYDYVHSSVSNRHCRIFCLWGNEMEVYVEDTSGNGTLINNTALLHKNERRKLHTGDVICLVNPGFLSKRIKSAAERKSCMSMYSYVFVNLWEQEARGISPKNNSRGAVNPYAVRMHSAPRNRLASRPQQSSSKKNTSLSSLLQAPKSRRIELEYDIREQLGTGTCGEVRRAIHRRSGRECAVKIIQISRNGHYSEEMLNNIIAEAEILRSLDHPYIVQLYDAFVSPGKAIYLVMELMLGGDLFDRIAEREKYEEDQARRLMRRILAAVYHLHEERGIVHRDLKPENILVVSKNSDVNIKLSDFGVAKNMTAEGLKTFCGTPQYFAPEVLKRRNTVKGDGRYGKEIDCWSIGVILFILLSGSPPFDVNESFDAVANGRIKFYPDQWKGVSPEAKKLVMGLLQRDPAKRMSVKDACEHAWVLKEDGDTHCHPLLDPLIAKARDEAAASAAAESEDDTMNLTEEMPSEAVHQADSLPCGESASEPSEDLKPRSSEEMSNKHEASVTARTKNIPFEAVYQAISLPNEESAFEYKESFNASEPRSHFDDDKAAASMAFKTVRSPSSEEQSTKRSNLNDCVREADERDCVNVTQTKSTLQNQIPKSHIPAAEQGCDQKENRQQSIMPYDNGKSVTKAISQAMDVSLKSPNHGSPINRKKLFIKDVEVPETARRLSKANAESIKSAGETLPKPVLQATVQNRPKKEKGISSYFSAAAPKTKLEETKFSGPNTTKFALSEKKRKQETSTITPPVGEQLVFSLNKRIKTNAKPRKSDMSEETKQNEASTSKAELSEDELQSDFSDTEEIQDPCNKDRKTDERNSLATKPFILTQQLANDKITNITYRQANAKVEHKKIQSHLFGKPPSKSKITETDEGDDIEIDELNGPRAVTSDSKADNMQCNSLIEPKDAPTRGNQKSIKSWFLPKAKK